MHKKTIIFSLFLISNLICTIALAENLPITLFPLKHYDQNVDRWLSPQDPQYKKPLLTESYQKDRLKQFYDHVFSSSDDGASPWSPKFVSAVINKAPGILDSVKSSLTGHSNRNKSERGIGYGQNFRPHGVAWMRSIINNVALDQFTLPMAYKPERRAIVTRNTSARILPTRDPHFFSYEIPGQGYPFDNLQTAALWVGMPVYVIGKTKDASWSLVLTPSYIGWLESDAIAVASPSFVKRWEKAVQKGLAAITHTEAPILSASSKNFQFAAYVGSVFPLLDEEKGRLKIQIPIRNADGNAEIKEALVDAQYATKMPLAATPEHFAMLMKTLQNRPYGWGGNNFYNDCSAELQSLYTPFGIWLPRNSAQQKFAGKVVDLDAAPAPKRLSYLMTEGHPLMTIVYIKGHIFMFMGNYPNPNAHDHQPMAMSYQNVWGLAPRDGSRRGVIGQSVLLPILNSYPEDRALNPLTNTKHFQMIYLDEWSDKNKPASELFF